MNSLRLRCAGTWSPPSCMELHGVPASTTWCPVPREVGVVYFVVVFVNVVFVGVVKLLLLLSCCFRWCCCGCRYCGCFGCCYCCGRD